MGPTMMDDDGGNAAAFDAGDNLNAQSQVWWWTVRQRITTKGAASTLDTSVGTVNR